MLADDNGDGCADLVVGSPGENEDTGWIQVFYGSSTGLRTTGVPGFTMTGLFGSGSSSRDQELGGTMTAGDLDGNGVDDLAASVDVDVDLQGAEVSGGAAVLTA